MTNNNPTQTRIDQLDEGDWLQLLLSDAQGELANQPTPKAVARIRRRVQAAMDTPTRAAA